MDCFSSSHVWMWELDHKESWASKNWCFWTVVLEKTLENLLGCKEIQLVNPKGNQSWLFIGRTDAETETPIIWPPDGKNWFIRKDLMLRKTEGRKRRGRQKMKWLDDITNSMDMSLSKLREMVKDQGSQACCSPWNLKESDVTEQLNSKLFSLAFTHLSISVHWNSKISNGLYSYWYGWI